MIDVKENVSLSDFTTLHLGGNATYFAECTHINEIHEAIEFARARGVRYHILGGGSNTIFLDEGFDGLVLRVALRGIQFIRELNDVKMVVAAGEGWDDFVKLCCGYGLAGVECLSGIPGMVGATPIQNVGAYGQEVAGTIVDVRALERRTLQVVNFTNKNCRFEYRQSRFNGEDRDAFIITEVTFKLCRLGEPELRYPELRKFIESSAEVQRLEAGHRKLESVRNAVLTLRRKKSMVLDPSDPNTRSVGSFFKNPLLTEVEVAAFEARVQAKGITSAIPTFPAGQHVKVPAAWLVEHAGFPKGYRKGGAGVSSNHSLALVNCGGTTRELLSLADEIRSNVLEKFGVQLEREPLVVR